MVKVNIIYLKCNNISPVDWEETQKQKEEPQGLEFFATVSVFVFRRIADPALLSLIKIECPFQLI